MLQLLLLSSHIPLSTSLSVSLPANWLTHLMTERRSVPRNSSKFLLRMLHSPPLFPPVSTASSLFLHFLPRRRLMTHACEFCIQFVFSFAVSPSQTRRERNKTQSKTESQASCVICIPCEPSRTVEGRISVKWEIILFSHIYL